MKSTLIKKTEGLPCNNLADRKNMKIQKIEKN